MTQHLGTALGRSEQGSTGTPIRSHIEYDPVLRALRLRTDKSHLDAHLSKGRGSGSSHRTLCKSTSTPRLCLPLLLD
jgi:hypothetical protein